MVSPAHFGPHGTERRLIAAARCLALAFPRQDSLRGVADAELTMVLPRPLAERLVGDLALFIAEIALIRHPGLMFGRPDALGLRDAEFDLLAALCHLQAGRLSDGLEVLQRAVGDTRTGRLLLPLKLMAVRLAASGFLLQPIGQRRFQVVNGGRLASASRSRAHLRSA